MLDDELLCSAETRRGRGLRGNEKKWGGFDAVEGLMGTVERDNTNRMKGSAMRKKNMFSAILVGAVLVLLGATSVHSALLGFEQEVLDDTPYAYWRFNEASGSTANDDSGNNRDGVYNNSPTLGVTGMGGAGSDDAVGFDGSNDYMNSDISGFGSKMLNSTFEAVFMRKSSSIGYLFGILNNANVTAVQFSIDDNQSIFYLRDSDYTSTSEWKIPSSQLSIPRNEYVHLMIAIDGDNSEVNIFLNGDLSASKALSGDYTFSDFQYDFPVGGRNVRGTNQDFLNADIDEFALYDKALTQADAQRHYDAIFVIPEPGTVSLGLVFLAVYLIRRKLMK
jgi:hypothetical protein